MDNAVVALELTETYASNGVPKLDLTINGATFLSWGTDTLLRIERYVELHSKKEELQITVTGEQLGKMFKEAIDEAYRDGKKDQKYETRQTLRDIGFGG